eukprot:30394-Pelagococcus_subviridis.AAC.3
MARRMRPPRLESFPRRRRARARARARRRRDVRARAAVAAVVFLADVASVRVQPLGRKDAAAAAAAAAAVTRPPRAQLLPDRGLDRVLLVQAPATQIPKPQSAGKVVLVVVEQRRGLLQRLRARRRASQPAPAADVIIPAATAAVAAARAAAVAPQTVVQQRDRRVRVRDLPRADRAQPRLVPGAHDLRVPPEREDRNVRHRGPHL